MPSKRSSRITPRSIEAQVQSEVESELDELVAAIAAEEGLAQDAVHLSPDKEVELWGQKDPRVDYDTLKSMLMQGSVPPEWYDEHSDARLAVVRANPEMAPLFAEPLDEEMASTVADLAESPFRLSVLKPWEDDPKGAVRKADSINARWLRKTGQAPETDDGGYARTDARGGTT